MYRMDIYYTIKTLHAQGLSQRAIAKELGIHRKTVRAMLARIAAESVPDRPQRRPKKLDAYKEEILCLVEKNYTGVLIQSHFAKRGIEIAYSTLNDYLRVLKPPEVFVPQHAGAGEEAQVDFGYLGYFCEEGQHFKVWGFCMVLSHSRYAYYQVVKDQSVNTFLRAHMLGFEYFGGVPEVVKIDNLKAGVLEASFYEPLIQQQYAAFLKHYGSNPITCRIGRGQDKGKVESGIKYLKNNFLRGFGSKSYALLGTALREWNDQVCNLRTHGTTRRIPSEVFAQIEKPALRALPQQRFALFYIESRKVNNYGHICFDKSYYSVPYPYIGSQVYVAYNDDIIRIYEGIREIALHSLASQPGSFVSREEHKPPYKQARSEESYRSQAAELGEGILEFLLALQNHKPRSWKNMIQGIFQLCRHHPPGVVEAACKKAIHYEAYSYQQVKNICKLGLYDKDILPQDLPALGGYALDLRAYDQMVSPQQNPA